MYISTNTWYVCILTQTYTRVLPCTRAHLIQHALSQRARLSCRCSRTTLNSTSRCLGACHFRVGDTAATRVIITRLARELDGLDVAHQQRALLALKCQECRLMY
jgi:hypothetical protein